MGTIQDSIGTRFERFFMQTFSGFENHTDDQVVPDFYKPEFGFWVEAKCGNFVWGSRLKEDQETRFREIQEPIVYFLGLHNFNNAYVRLAGRTEERRQEKLRRHMDLVETYWFTQPMVAKVIHAEKRLNQKGTIRYCMMKRHIFRDVLFNRAFRRYGKAIASAEEYYGYNREEFDFYDLRKASCRGNVKGVVLTKTELNVREYLKSVGVLEF